MHLQDVDMNAPAPAPSPAGAPAGRRGGRHPQVARIAALGFEAVDIWSAYDKCPHLDDAATRLGP